MYYVVYGLMYLLSLLPLRILYLLSDLAYFIIYHLAGYRKQVVMNNLLIAFPEKTDQERKQITKKFYKNLTDTFIETIKLLSASKRFITKHFACDASLAIELFDKGKKCQAHLGHNFNWELANSAFPYYSPNPFLCVYMPINNGMVDRLFKKIRSRTGTILLPATKMSQAMIPYRNEKYLLALVADQNPGVPSRAYWLNFFGRPTPFVKGPEKGARANNSAVIFVHITKLRRGYYEAHLQLATEDPILLPEGEITRRYIVFLEEVIRKSPEMWLWSHRRWKHEWKPEYGPLL